MGTLQNGVCYDWPNLQCQLQTIQAARLTCAGMGARVCTVAELDRLDGTGCGGDVQRAWAELALTAGAASGMYGLCVRDDGGINAAGGVVRQSDADDDDIASCTPVQASSPTATSQVDGLVMCCYD